MSKIKLPSTQVKPMKAPDQIVVVYVTKYFSTSGILTWRVRLFKSSFGDTVYGHKVDVNGKNVGYSALTIGKDCFEKLEDAVEAAKQIKIKKIASLEKQIKKIVALSFDAQPLE